MTPQQRAILRQIDESTPIAIGELAQRSSVFADMPYRSAATTIGLICGALVRRGLIERLHPRQAMWRRTRAGTNALYPPTKGAAP